MISIRFKLVWIVIALVGAYLIVNNASAQTINGYFYNALPDPTYSQASDVITLSNFDETGTYYISFEVDGSVANGGGNRSCPIQGPCGIEANDGYIFGPLGIFRLVGVSDVSAYTVCSSTDYSTCSNSPEYAQYAIFDYTVQYIPPPPVTNQTWGDDGFWGASVTTEDVKNDMVASVQATGANLWPMLIFLGVVLAFAIFGYLVTSIKDSVRPQNRRRRSKTFDPVSFNRKADELQEFFGRTGGASDEIVEAIRKTKK